MSNAKSGTQIAMGKNDLIKKYCSTSNPPIVKIMTGTKQN